MKFLFSGIAFIFLAVSGFAQDVGKDLEKLSAAFSSARSISVDLVYTMYRDDSEKDIISTSTGSFRKQSSNSYYRMDQMEMVNGDKFSLLVYHDTKVMMLNPRNRSATQRQEQLWDFDFAKASENYSSVTRNKVSKDVYCYSIEFKTGDFTRIDIAFNSSENLVVWIKLYSRNEQAIDEKGTLAKPVVKVEYRNLQFNGEMHHSWFETGRYLNYYAGKYSLLEKYKDYQFFNLLADNN